MTAPLLQLVRNPASGSHDPELIAVLVHALEGRGFRVELGTSSACEPFRPNPLAAHVCVAGGDGTVRHVAAAIAMQPSPPGFSVYPMGTINLVAREWGVPRDPEGFARHVATEAARRGLHLAAINDSWFIACASIGPDADAVAGVSETLKARIGRLAYGISLLRILWGWTPPRLSVEADGKRHDCEALYIANGRFYAGPWVVAPRALLATDSLELAMLTKAGRFRFLIFLIAVLTGQTRRLANLKIVEARRITISADRPVSIQIDGDDGMMLPVVVTAGAGKLNG